MIKPNIFNTYRDTVLGKVMDGDIKKLKTDVNI